MCEDSILFRQPLIYSLKSQTKIEIMRCPADKFYILMTLEV